MAFQLPGEAEITRQRKDDSKFVEGSNDVVIKVGNESFPANRSTLARYSQYFRAMFTVNMKEHNQNTVEIEDVDKASWKILFDFIHSGRIVINCKNVTGVLSVADYFGIDDAKEFCFEFLESVLSIESCFPVLRILNTYNNASFKKKVYNFVSENFVKIFQKYSLEDLAEKDLLSFVSSLNKDKVNNNLLFKTIINWVEVNEETRKHIFPQLISHIDFTKVSPEFICESVVTEKLIVGNPECAKLVMRSVSKVLIDMSSAWPSSKIYSIGGDGTPSKVSLIYNLLDDVPKNYPDVPHQDLSEVCAVRLNDFVYCIGGRKSGIVSSAVWRLNVNNLEWEEMAPMLNKRSKMGASVLQNRIIVSGGFDDQKNALKSAEVYDVSQNRWSSINDLRESRGGNEQVTCNDCVYSLGGNGIDGPLTSVEKLNGIDGIWEFVKPMLTPRCNFAAVTIDRKIYGIGGWNHSGPLKTVEQYCPQTNEWCLKNSMDDVRYGHAACKLQGKIYLAGGEYDSSVLCYDLSLDSWNVVGKNADEGILYLSLFTV